MGHNRFGRKSDQLLKNIGAWAVLRREFRLRRNAEMLQYEQELEEKAKITNRLKLQGSDS